MTSPYSTNLLQQPVEPARRFEGPAPQPPSHTRSVTHVVAQPQPMYLPAPVQAVHAAAPQRGGGVAALALALVVILLGAVALVGAYYATTQAAPSTREAAVVQNIAARDGFRAGRDRGIDVGRQQALENTSTTTALRAATARQAAYAAAFRRGERAGRNSYRAPRFVGGGGYRAPRYGGFRTGGDVSVALGQAQNIANLTGAPVDVEIY